MPRPKKLVQHWLLNATESQLLHAAVGNTPSLADVVKMVHPKPQEAWRAAWFAWLIGRPFKLDELPPLTQAFERYKADRTQPLPDVPFQLLTALELDQQGYAYYPKTYPIKITDGEGYTSAKYGLASALDATTFDPTKGDLFAGLDASVLGPTAAPYVAPTETPEPTAVATQTATVNKAAAAAATTDTQTPSDTRFPDGVLLICCGVVSLIALAGVIFLKKGTRLKLAAIIVCAVFLLSFAFFAVRYSKQRQSSSSDATSPQVEAGKATPEPKGSVEPTAEPTPTPDPEDQYYRSASDPAEVVVIDPKNEHWEYRSDTLSIIIDRVP